MPLRLTHDSASSSSSSFRLVNFLERKTDALHKGDHHYTGVSSLTRFSVHSVLFISSIFNLLTVVLNHFTFLQQMRLQDRVLNDVVIRLLGDDDPRVRHVAASAVSRYTCFCMFIGVIISNMEVR